MFASISMKTPRKMLGTGAPANPRLSEGTRTKPAVDFIRRAGYIGQPKLRPASHSMRPPPRLPVLVVPGGKLICGEENLLSALGNLGEAFRWPNPMGAAPGHGLARVSPRGNDSKQCRVSMSACADSGCSLRQHLPHLLDYSTGLSGAKPFTAFPLLCSIRQPLGGYSRLFRVPLATTACQDAREPGCRPPGGHFSCLPLIG